jgi:hypothetical protein
LTLVVSQSGTLAATNAYQSATFCLWWQSLVVVFGGAVLSWHYHVEAGGRRHKHTYTYGGMIYDEYVGE